MKDLFSDLKDTTRFEPLREHRGTHLVEYHVPNENYPFAVLQLTYLQATPIPDVARAMVDELERWARRYPVPIMVTAFDDTGNVMRLTPTKATDHAIGWIERDGRTVVHWEELKNEAIPCEPFTLDRLLEVYPDVPRIVSTAEDKRKSIAKTVRGYRSITNVVIVWFVGVPIAIALITQFVAWAGWIAFAISILNGLRELAKIKGWIKPSKRQQEKNEEERRMKHHHYWCERNPAGFGRLMGEAIDQEERERTRKEAEELRKQLGK